MSYAHTQSGRPLVLFLVGAAVVAFAASLVSGGNPALLLAAALLALTAWLFSSLTVRVGDGWVSARFGPGFLALRWPLEEITAARAVRNPWSYGIGIHLTPGGWLYNISGRDAVEITLRSGRRRRIGTDDPDALVRAIRREAGIAR